MSETASLNPFDQPSNPQYAPISGPSQSYYEQQAFLPQQNYERRPKNFPPCKPIVHHSIATDIAEHKRTLIRKAYFGWMIHSFCLFWNMICMIAAIVVGYTGITGFLVGLGGGILGPALSFFVYFLMYSAVRKGSTSNYVMWFCLFFLQIIYEIIQAIGIASIGSAGFAVMLNAFTGSRVPLGIMFAISCAFWGGAALYNILILLAARRDYNSLGGNQAATREFGTHAVTFAYDNRDTIKQVAKDNQDTIKRVALENQDAIVQIGSDAVFNPKN